MSDTAPSPESMSRAELEAEVEERREQAERIDVFESRLDSINGTLDRFDKHLFGDQDVIGPFDDEVQDAPGLWSQVDALRSEVADARRNGGATTKKELVERVARDEGVRVSRQGKRGGTVDAPAVREIVERQYDVTVRLGTVHDGFESLEERYECFAVRTGEPGPNTRNTQLQCERGEITAHLRNAVENSQQNGFSG